MGPRPPLQVLEIEHMARRPSCRTVLTPYQLKDPSDVFFVLCATPRICETAKYESATCWGLLCVCVCVCVCARALARVRAPPAVSPCAFVLDFAINSDYFVKLY
jgi:hypothetical protein